MFGMPISCYTWEGGGGALVWDSYNQDSSISGVFRAPYLGNYVEPLWSFKKSLQRRMCVMLAGTGSWGLGF